MFDRIYLYSKSSTIDKTWDPLRRHVEKEQGVRQEDEKTFFDDFDAQALQEQMDLQMQVAEEAKKQKVSRSTRSEYRASLCVQEAEEQAKAEAKKMKREAERAKKAQVLGRAPWL